MRSEDVDDPWLTLAEIAAELRMSPATVRSWVGKGTLQATRAGERKWLVRRSEVDRLLRPQNGDPSRTVRAPDTVSPPTSPTWGDDEKNVDPEDWFGIAEHEWHAALSVSRHAPPDGHFPQRLQLIAEAAARKAGALALLSPDETAYDADALQAGIGLSYELSPAAQRPGPPELWDEVDRCVTQLASAIHSASVGEQQRALEALSIVLNDIVDALPAYRGHYGEWTKRPVG